MSSKRKPKQKAYETLAKNNFELRRISPLNVNQEKVFDAYSEGMNMVLHGYAGTGKSFIPLYLGIEEILCGSPVYSRIVIVRSAVPSRDVGFLPGNLKEKIKVYEEPYREIVNDLFDRGDAYDILKTRSVIEFTTTSYLRGTTFNNAIVIVDEIQNMCFSELDTTMTRLGDNSKIILCGDYRQTDLIKDRDKSGLSRFLNITKKMRNFAYIEFQKEDIVRSGTVRDYIITKTELGI